MTQAVDSLVSERAIASSRHLNRVLVGYDTFIRPGSCLEDSLLMSGCAIGPDVRMRGVLMDKNCTIEDGAESGYDETADQDRFPFRTPSGIVVLPKGTTVPRNGPIRLAFDLADLLSRDPDTRKAMASFAGEFAIADLSRHSHMSHGPRYETND